MEPDDFLCSRNARSRTPLARADGTFRRASGWAGEKVVRCAQWEINQLPSLERERASLERPSIIVNARAAMLDGLFELPVGPVDPVSHSE
jgi:hypothetical protein